MSMNLCFITKEGKHHIEFPYQTTTKVTYAVLALTSKEEQFTYLLKDIDECGGDYYLKKEVREMLYDNTLELTMI